MRQLQRSSDCKGQHKLARRHCGRGRFTWVRAVRSLWRIEHVALLAVVLCSGCEERIETVYGGRTGPLEGPSVNGTAVLSDMIAGAGHNVISRTSLSPGLRDSTDVIVWFPNDFRVPDPKVMSWLENWLGAKSGRMLVYVGRDFDAAVEYWKAVAPGAPPEESTEIKLRLDQAKSDFDQARSTLLDGESCNWFTVKALAKPRAVTTLQGPWSNGIDPKKCDIQHYSTFQFNAGDRMLLADNTDTLAAERQFFSADSWAAGGTPNKLIVVANGSFLLNFQLVNREHRKLAAHLIAELPPASRVVFLESNPGGPPIRESETVARTPNGLELFAVWPLGGVLLHLAALGLVFCFARLPIFGMPRDPPAEPLSDFGRHITALGELLHLTRDRGYAEQRLAQYHQISTGDSTAGRKKSKPPSALLKV